MSTSTTASRAPKGDTPETTKRVIAAPKAAIPKVAIPDINLLKKTPGAKPTLSKLTVPQDTTPMPAPSAANTAKPKACFRCKSTEHLRRDCPVPKPDRVTVKARKPQQQEKVQQEKKQTEKKQTYALALATASEHPRKPALAAADPKPTTKPETADWCSLVENELEKVAEQATAAAAAAAANDGFVTIKRRNLPTTTKRQSRPTTAKRQNPPPTAASGNRHKRCYRCHEVGHVQRKCPSAIPGSQRPSGVSRP